MPVFENVDISAQINLEFEVYCDNCGKGLCNSSNTRMSRNRNFPQVSVGLCDACYGELEYQMKELKREKESLLAENEELRLQLGSVAK